MTTSTLINTSGIRHPRTVPIGLNKPVGKSLRPAIQKIVDELKPEKLFCLVPTPHSDVDLLIVLKTNASQKERHWKVLRLLIPRPFPIDILVKTPKEIAKAIKSGDFFSQEILSRARSSMSEINNPQAWVEKAEEDFALAQSALQRKTPLVTIEIPNC